MEPATGEDADALGHAPRRQRKASRGWAEEEEAADVAADLAAETPRGRKKKKRRREEGDQDGAAAKGTPAVPGSGLRVRLGSRKGSTKGGRCLPFSALPFCISRDEVVLVQSHGNESCGWDALYHVLHISLTSRLAYVPSLVALQQGSPHSPDCTSTGEFHLRSSGLSRLSICRVARWPPATPAQLAAAGKVVRVVARGDHGWPFAAPVTDDIAPGYSAEIARPMDLGTIEQQLKGRAYADLGGGLIYGKSSKVLAKLAKALAAACCLHPCHHVRRPDSAALAVVCARSMLMLNEDSAGSKPLSPDRGPSRG